MDERWKTTAKEAPGGKLKAVFGPVPSRRLGRSLGIDPIPPKVIERYGARYVERERRSV